MRSKQRSRHTKKRPRPRRNQWITPKFKRQIKHQHRLHQRRLDNPTTHNIQTHRKYRNQLRKRITQAKRDHLHKQLQDTKHDPKQQAKILKTIIPSKNQDRQTPATIIYENKTYTNPQDIANAFNDFFITVGEKTSQTIPHYPPDPNPREEAIRQDRPKHPPFKLRQITTDELAKIMKRININKANDIYKIKPAIIKDLTTFLAPTLTRLFNQAINEHQYPDALKITEVIELFKKQDRHLPQYYRPISLLPIIAKLLDTLINNQP